MKKFLALLLLLLGCSVLQAQMSTVLGVVTDNDGTVWANGTWSIAFTPNPNNPNPAVYNINGVPLSAAVTQQNGTLNGSGAFTVSVYQSNAITPVGSQWTLTICPNAVTSCGIYTFAAVGTPINVSTVLTTLIPVPRFAAVAGTYGYTDTEAQLQLKPGSTYWNVTSNLQRCYNAQAATWGGCSTGGGGGGLASLNGQTGPAVAITSLDGSVVVTPGGNNVDLHVTAGGGGANPVQYLASNTAHLFIGDSRFLVASMPTAGNSTVTAVSCNGTVCTMTGTNTFVANQHVELSNDGAAWSPACMNGNRWLTNTKVSATGLSGSSFQIPESDTACTGVQTGTGGLVWDATYTIPWRTAAEPFFLNQTTFINHGVPGETTTSLLANFASTVTPWLPPTLGVPVVVHIQLGSQNFLGCATTEATAQTELQSIMQQIHAAGAKIALETPISVFSSNFCEDQNPMNVFTSWINTLRKSSANVSSGQYADYLVAAREASGFANNPLFFQQFGDADPDHLKDPGTAKVADAINEAFSSQVSAPNIQPIGFTPGPLLVDVTGGITGLTGGIGLGLFDAKNYTGNGDPGVYGFQMDEASSPPTPTLTTPNPATHHEIRFKKVSYDGNGPRDLVVAQTSKLCWTNEEDNGNGATIAGCLKQVTPGEYAFGNSTSGSDASLQLDAAKFKIPGCAAGTVVDASGAGCITNGGITAPTCNANGCYVQLSDGSYMMDGNSSTLGGATSASNLTITFPVTLSSTTNLFVTASATSSATGDGNPHAADCHVVRSSLSTTGATAVIAAVVQIGGAGYANLAAGDYCTWHAFGK